VKQIWKFEVPFHTEGRALAIPQGGIIRACGANPVGSAPSIWVEVDPSAILVNRLIEYYGTGQPLPSDGGYLGTALCGDYVWHIYERPL
jgi:hypothetical protein